MRSVPPAMGRTGASGVPPASTAYAASRSRGLVTGGSIDTDVGGSAPAATAAEEEQDQRRDDAEPRDDLAGCHRRHRGRRTIRGTEIGLDRRGVEGVVREGRSMAVGRHGQAVG